MTNIAKFNIAISELVDIPNPSNSHHPFATIAKFIFADDQPNGNKQGLKVEEFPSVMTSAIGMPVKMNFTGFGVSNHAGSIPIGHIKNMEAIKEGEVNQILAEAMLWKEEFPEEVAYLKEAHASGEAPGLSYEIAYEESDTIDSIQWIRGTTTQAATFVANPAYGSRTHLLALASLKNEEERNVEILALAEQIKLDNTESDENTEKGGKLMEEELQQAQAEVTRLLAEAEAKDARITDLETEVATATTDKETALAELETIKEGAKIDNRVRQYVEAGFTMEAEAEKADARKSVFASFDDAQWDIYLTDLKTNKPAPAPKDKGGEAFASLRREVLEIPKPESLDAGSSNLKNEMRSLARPHSI